MLTASTLHIEIRVPGGRDTAGFATLTDGTHTIAKGAAVASVAPALAQKNGNPLRDPLRPWGDPPLGRYEMLALGPAPAGSEREYGPHLLAFEPKSGQALDAESYGRLGLLVYAGPTGQDRNLRVTQGGVRLSTALMREIQARLHDNTRVEISIVAMKPRSWWQFWRSVPPRLSAEIPIMAEPPFDETTLLQQLMRGARRRIDQADTSIADDDRWRDRDSSSSASSGADAPFEGGGGRSGGGGASGSWQTDGAGRIVAGAAIGAAAAAAIGAATATAAAADTGTESSTAY